ncbi:hypothetical protein KQ306_03480 [Synechococcus sp. CS-1324]|uniref:hypothetical protein n=1 Tax=Synechococcus sp. CS-1324 TaxID=2847980 RepID=UPI000DB01F18|nr:hypothetical protein [Synechococcus sp. CS-1324]MCT0229924.1 hypothetical protein [Synechococcus sp. CS-1324]PZV02444.1 MAG: hypothetical protein DCF23_11580 [Cyanobium sp.]
MPDQDQLNDFIEALETLGNPALLIFTRHLCDGFNDELKPEPGMEIGSTFKNPRTRSQSGHRRSLDRAAKSFAPSLL